MTNGSEVARSLDDAADRLQDRIAYRFRDIDLLKRALTHRSATAENLLQSNERLEFLGDSVLSLVICDRLLKQFPDNSEGDLAKARAYIVSEHALAIAARELGLQECVRLGTAEVASGGAHRRSILSDAFEALIAAVYLDGGLEAARRVAVAALEQAIIDVAEDRNRRDCKSSLQERTQAISQPAPSYRIVTESGKDHEKVFEAEAVIGELVLGRGRGGTKKEAQQAAAAMALEQIEELLPALAGGSSDRKVQ